MSSATPATVSQSGYKRFDASLLFSVDSLISSQPLKVVFPSKDRIEIYERGGCEKEFDNRLTMTIKHNKYGTWGILRHTNGTEWSFMSKTAIGKMVRDAADFNSISEFCKSLGRSDGQRLAALVLRGRTSRGVSGRDG